jgi:hypothetical protein
LLARPRRIQKSNAAPRLPDRCFSSKAAHSDGSLWSCLRSSFHAKGGGTINFEGGVTLAVGDCPALAGVDLLEGWRAS